MEENFSYKDGKSKRKFKFVKKTQKQRKTWSKSILSRQIRDNPTCQTNFKRNPSRIFSQNNSTQIFDRNLQLAYTKPKFNDFGLTLIPSIGENLKPPIHAQVQMIITSLKVCCLNNFRSHTTIT